MFFTSYIEAAFKEAEKAALKNEFPIGAVIVSPSGKIISRTHNLVQTNHDPTAHAEILALRDAAEKTGNERLYDHDMYVTLEPCTMCAGAISHARIRRLYYAAEDAKGGAISSGVRFFDAETCLHKPEFYYPFEEERAAKMLKDFAKGLRKC